MTHEVGIIRQTLDIALDRAYTKGASQIHWLKMRIGKDSGVVPEALEFAFDVVTKGTIAEDARLEIETVPVICHCSKCNLDFQPIKTIDDLNQSIYECPLCGRLSEQILAGKEIELVSLEVS